MTPDLVIREATAADAGRLAELRYEFRSALRPAVEEKEAFLGRCTIWMRRRLAADWKCWVATSGEEIVGQIWLQVVEKLPNPGREPERHGYITNLYLKPEFRGGVGGKLLARALEWASRQEVDAVILWPTARSRSLYLRHGFQAPADMLELRAPKPGK